MNTLSTPVADPPVAPRWSGRLARLPGAAWLLLTMTVCLAAAKPEFISAQNLGNIGLQAAVLTIVAMGMTFVILTEGIDLSVGPVLGLCGVVFALLLTGGQPLALALLATLALGAVVGAANGALVAAAGMPPFIVTLGMFGIAQSAAMILTGGNSVTGLPTVVRLFNEGVVLGLPVPVWASMAVFGLSWLLLHHTRFGRYTLAIGGNRRALRLCGARVDLWHAAVYAYAGLLTALASLIMTARMNAAHPTIAIGLEFDAIAAVILGGTSFEKGRGGVVGTLVGVFAVAVLRNGLNLVGVSAEWQVATVGLVIICAVALDSFRNRGS